MQVLNILSLLSVHALTSTLDYNGYRHAVHTNVHILCPASGIAHAFLRVLTDDFVDGGMFAVRQEFLLFLHIVGFSLSLGSTGFPGMKGIWFRSGLTPITIFLRF